MKFCHARNTVTDKSRYYIDGKRVSRGEFETLRSQCVRDGSYDSLWTITTPSRNLIRHLASGRLP